MPWKETCVMDQRVRFIAALQEDPRGNFSRLCERFGIARSVGYKWVERYRELGLAGLADRESVARECRHKTPPAVEDRVVALTKRCPFDGRRSSDNVCSTSASRGASCPRRA